MIPEDKQTTLSNKKSRFRDKLSSKLTDIILKCAINQRCISIILAFILSLIIILVINNSALGREINKVNSILTGSSIFSGNQQ